MSTYICKLPPEVQKYAEHELHETEENRQNGFEEIKKWAAENPSLHVRTEEKYILLYLRSCKFDLEKTKGKLQKFNIGKRDRPEWLANRNPFLSEIKDLVKMGCCVFLRQTYENQLVAILKPMFYDPNIYTVHDFLKTAIMMIDIGTMEEELGQVYGLIYIVDMTNMSFAHIRQYSISQLKSIAQLWETYHSRTKKLEFINAPSILNIILNVFKRFLSKKLKERIHVNNDGTASLCNIINKSILPKDYGGEGEEMEDLQNYWSEKLTSYADWFAEDAKYVAE